MGSDTKYFVRLRIGHKSEMLDRPTSTGMTHRWIVYVHSLSGTPFTDRSFISKVVFELHPDFPSPRRVVKEPPFEVSELGYAGFSIPIHITFTGASKVYKLTYDMNLVLEKHNEQYIIQTIEIKQPSSSFRELILKYGGVKKDSDKKKEKDRSRKGTANLSEEPPLKKAKEQVENRPESNPPLGKLKIRRSLVEGGKRQKDSKFTSFENLANHALKPVFSAEIKVSLSSEAKTNVTSEVKQPELISCGPSTSTESNCSDSEGSRATLFTESSYSSATVVNENDGLVDKQYDFEFLLRLQKKLTALKEPDKMIAVADALLMSASSSPSLPPDVSLTDDNILSFDIYKLNSTLIGKLGEICFGSAC